MEGSSAKAAGPGHLHPGHGWRTGGHAAAGAGSGGHLQDGAEDVGGGGQGKVAGGRLHGRALITEWTPGTSPGCHRDGCCCWSRCHSSGGWSSWLPPAASSACSSGGRVGSMSKLAVQSTAHPGLFHAHAASSRLTLGLRPTAEAGDKNRGSGTGFQGSNPGSTTY